MRLRFRAALAALAAVLAACAAEPSEPDTASPAALAADAARLPVTAAGFLRGESRPTTGAAAGREVAYATDGDRRTTAAANVELLAEPTAAAPALDAALAEASRAGPARAMRESGRFAVAPSGGASLLCAETIGRYGREQVAGLVCTGRARGALVRIRVAMPAQQPPPADLRAFAVAIAAALPG